jgi:hypothetical protein
MAKGLTRFHWREESILDLYNLLLGVFLAASPWLFAYARGIVRTEAWLTSAVLIAVSLAAIVAFAQWEEWINVGIGLWLILSPWILGFPHTHAMHISIGVGILVTYLAGLKLCIVHTHYSPSEPGLR